MSAKEPAKPPLSCPCASGRTYAQCCGLLHGGEIAITAEALMRSRYSAYVLRLAPYLLSSWHVSTRPPTLDLTGNTTWLGLSVKRHLQTGENAAIVEFVARYRSGGGSAVRLHEISRFVREDRRWYYVEAEVPERA